MLNEQQKLSKIKYNNIRLSNNENRVALLTLQQEQSRTIARFKDLSKYMNYECHALEYYFTLLICNNNHNAYENMIKIE